MYKPVIDDYVRWKTEYHDVEGWVYFADPEYISIEIGVKDKPKCEYTVTEKHKRFIFLWCVITGIGIIRIY